MRKPIDDSLRKDYLQLIEVIKMRKAILILAASMLLAACSHPVRDERNALRAEFRAHCVNGSDYSPHRCRNIKHKLVVDDLALAYGTAR